MPKNSFTHKPNPWDTTRDSYTKWFANSKLKYFFSKNLKYENLSLWWITNNANKDNTSENKWYRNLKILLNKEKKIDYQKKIFLIIFILKITKNFFRDIIFCFLLKLLFKTRFKKIKKKIVFILQNLI